MTFLNKDILVTGGTGLVGSACKRIMPEARYISSKEVDLRSLKQTESFVEKCSPGVILHLAGRVGGLKANSEFLGDFFDDNILINTHVLQSAKKYNVKKVISFLSTCIFPDQAAYPLKESYLHSGEPHESNFAYAYAKRMIEVQSRAYFQQHGLEYQCLVPTNIYGPNDNFNLEDGHVAPSLIHKCYLAKQNNTDFNVWGSGKPLREFIYSDDIARLSEWALRNYHEKEPLILSTSEEVSIKELVLVIADAVGFKGKIVFDATKPDGQYRKPTDNSKLLELRPNFKFTPLEEGIEKSVNWFIENYETCRK
jgi:GDP-L-fucose synthase